jgi:hypothetical protein
MHIVHERSEVSTLVKTKAVVCGMTPLVLHTLTIMWVEHIAHVFCVTTARLVFLKENSVFSFDLFNCTSNSSDYIASYARTN